MEEQGKTEWLLCPRRLDAVQTAGSVCAAIIFRACSVGKIEAICIKADVIIISHPIFHQGFPQ